MNELVRCPALGLASNKLQIPPAVCHETGFNISMVDGEAQRPESCPIKPYSSRNCFVNAENATEVREALTLIGLQGKLVEIRKKSLLL